MHFNTQKTMVMKRAGRKKTDAMGAKLKKVLGLQKAPESLPNSNTENPLPSRTNRIVITESDEKSSEENSYGEIEIFEHGDVSNRINKKIQFFRVLIFTMVVIGSFIFMTETRAEFIHFDYNRSLWLVWSGHATIYLTIILVLGRLHLEKRFLQATLRERPDTWLLSGNRKWQFLLELILNLIDPYPQLIGIHLEYENSITKEGVETYYNYNDILFVLSMLKVLFYSYMVLNIGKFASSSAHRLCILYGTCQTSRFVMKSRLQHYPFQVLPILIVAITIFFAVNHQVLEYPSFHCALEDALTESVQGKRGKTSLQSEGGSDNCRQGEGLEGLYGRALWQVVITFSTGSLGLTSSGLRRHLPRY